MSWGHVSLEFEVKLHALKGVASRCGTFLLYCAPSCLPVGRDPAYRQALKGGAYGALAGQSDSER